MNSSSDHGRWALVDRPERLVLTVAEAAELLGISKSLAYDLVARGELPARRFGGRIVILMRPLKRLLDGEPVDDASGPPAGLQAVAETADRPSRAS
jgi:excisionase family DNA binding protein